MAHSLECFCGKYLGNTILKPTPLFGTRCRTGKGEITTDLTRVVESKSDLSICCIRSRATGHNVAWSVHVVVVPNPVYIPIHAICVPHGNFRSRERDQNCFVAALCNISL